MVYIEGGGVCWTNPMTLLAAYPKVVAINGRRGTSRIYTFIQFISMYIKSSMRATSIALDFVRGVEDSNFLTIMGRRYFINHI